MTAISLNVANHAFLSDVVVAGHEELPIEGQEFTNRLLIPQQVFRQAEAREFEQAGVHQINTVQHPVVFQENPAIVGDA